MPEPTPRSDLASLRRLAAAARPDPFAEWRETNLERLAAEARHLDAVRRLEAVETRLRAAEARLAVAEEARRELAAIVRARERRLVELRETASWRITAPLRALRRLALDPFKAAPAAAAPAETAETAEPGQMALDPNLACRIDYPRGWHLTADTLRVVGWVFALDGAVVRGVRARLGETEFAGSYGIKRHDVFATFQRASGAEFSGFKVEVTAPAGRHVLMLEADIAGLGWRPFLRAEIALGQPAIQRDPTDYETWIADHDTLSAHDLAAIRNHIDRFTAAPLISILFPVYNPPEKWLRRALDSVVAQLYPHWELCAADDASTAPHVRTVLGEYAARDPRIKVVHRERNGHISAASNSALALATGAFVAGLDHDDELPPHALYEVAVLLQAHPDAGLVYTDEDKIDEEGQRYEPYFKPDWLPDLFLGQNYLSHLTVYRTALVRAVGGFREGFEGSQDWDLALRVIERLPAEAIHHLPRVLYHWRAIPGSTALLLAEKNYPVEAARRALTEHFARTGVSATLSPVPGDHWRIHYPVPDPAPRVTVIIPTRNQLPLLRACVDGLRAHTTYPAWEILVVDNGSDDPATLAWLADQSRAGALRVLRDEAPFNYSALNNAGVAAARGEIVALLNNDLTPITPGWLEEMVSHAVRPGIGAVGAMLYYPNDTVQHAGVVVGLGGVAGHPFKGLTRGAADEKNRVRLAQNFTAVTGACLVVRKALFDQVGGFDAAALPVAFNDVDFCLKLRAAGYRNLWTPFAEFHHHESASRGNETTPEKRARFAAEVETMLYRWGLLLRDDPAFNPNLALHGEDLPLARPPRVRKPWLLPAD